MFKEFKEFVMRGNVVDLAVGVIIGAAFGKIVTSFVNDILMPPLGLLIGNIDFSQLKLVLREVGADGKPVSVNYGSFINVVIDFTIMAFCVFLVVKAANAFNRKTPSEPSEKPCPECLMSIPIKAKRCGHCTAGIVSSKRMKIQAESNFAFISKEGYIRLGGQIMNRLPVVLLTLSAVLISLSACSKSHSNYPENPKAVLSAFLEADSQAAALSAASWPELARYTTWHDAPKWDKFTIVDRIEIGETRAGSTRAQIGVTYHNLGVMSTVFTPSQGPEDVVFYINQVDNMWKVDLPQLMPHVSWPVFQKRLNDASAAEPKTKAANDALISQIAAAAQHMH